MAIQTELTYDIDINGVTVDTIGLSDTLNNYTLDEISAYGYCGAYDISRRNNMEGSTSISWVQGFGGVFNYPFTVTPSGGSYLWTEGATGYNTPDGLYTAVIWLMKTGGSPSPDHFITSAALANYRLVTEWNVNKFVLSIPSLDGSLTNCAKTTWEQAAYPAIYCPQGNISMTYHTDRGEEDDETAAVAIYPYMLFIYNDNLYLHELKFDLADGAYIQASTQANGTPAPDFGSTGYISIDGSHSIASCVNGSWCSNGSSSGWSTVPALDYPNNNIMPITWQGPGGYTNWYHCLAEDEQNYVILFHHSGSQNVGGYIHFTALFSKVSDCLQYFANAGVYFYADKLYKPIIENSIVIGYSDDLTTESDIDLWDGDSNHNITPVPPAPPPTPGYDDDPWHGASFSGVSVGGIGAFARCYYMTSTELQNLRSWMGSINVPEGFDPMAQIIGLSQVPVALSGDAAENISFINSSAVYDPGVTTRVVDSGVASQYSMGLPKKYSLGSIDITRRMQERGEPYLDYSCQIELYLPLIGMFSLDTQTVMGRTIEAEAVLDPVSGTLAAYAWVSKDGQKLPIAYGSTTIGVDLPVTAQQYSVAKAALKQANAQLATSLLSSALTMVASASASGKAAAYGNGRATAASGMRNAREGFNSFTNAASIAASQTMVSQTGSVFGSFMDWGRSIRQLSYGNNTAIAGSFGGSTAQWSYPFTPYVKIIRPRFEKPLNYAHTQGVPCVQAKTVGSCTGFIQCVGVDVSGITRATDIERQAIQAALSNGVYAGGGE